MAYRRSYSGYRRRPMRQPYRFTGRRRAGPSYGRRYAARPYGRTQFRARTYRVGGRRW